MSTSGSLDLILNDIVNNHGWIAGSFVRDVLIRKDPTYKIRDIDVLIPYNLHQYLVRILSRKHSLKVKPIDINEEEEIAHTELFFGNITIDVFSSAGYEYLSPPDFDVNTLCWTGKEYTIWYPGHYSYPSDEEYYGYDFDVESIVDRIMRKEAIVKYP